MRRARSGEGQGRWTIDVGELKEAKMVDASCVPIFVTIGKVCASLSNARARAHPRAHQHACSLARSLARATHAPWQGGLDGLPLCIFVRIGGAATACGCLVARTDAHR